MKTSNKKSFRRGKPHFISYILIAVILVIALFPIFWMVVTSIKPEMQSYKIPPVWAFKPVMKNYLDAFHLRPILSYISNSIFIALVSTFFSIIIGIFAAYGFSRFRTSKSDQLKFTIFSFRILPPIAIALPIYLLWTKVGLIDTKLGLILVYTAMNLPFTVWVLAAFFDQLPKELDEAATIDGCSYLGALRRIILPIALPGLSAILILTFIFCWNEFAFSVILTNINAKTIPVEIAAFSGESRGTDWGKICAVANTITLPVIALTLAVQKYLVKGLSFGFIKE